MTSALHDQSLRAETEARIAVEAAHGRPGVVMCGHHQRVGNIERLFSGQLLRPAPDRVLVAEHVMTIGQDGTWWGYASGVHGEMTPEYRGGTHLAQVRSAPTGFAVATDFDLFDEQDIDISFRVPGVFHIPRLGAGTYQAFTATQPELDELREYLSVTLGAGERIGLSFRAHQPV